MLSTKGEQSESVDLLVEILEFTQFVDHFVFTPNAENVLEKKLKREIPVRVGIELMVVDMSRNDLIYKEGPQVFLQVTGIASLCDLIVIYDTIYLGRCKRFLIYFDS